MIHVSLLRWHQVYINYFQQNILYIFLVGAGGFDGTQSAEGASAEKKPEVNIIYL